MRKIQAQRSNSRVRMVRHFPDTKPKLWLMAGFTLIEVLIAMALLSIMVTLLFGSLKICAQSWERGENKISEVNEVASVYNFFQRHLPSAIPLWDDFTAKDGGYDTSPSGAGAEIGKTDKTFSFQGDKQSLQFVSAFPASVGRAGMQQFSIRPDKQDGELVIKVTLTPFFPLAEGKQWRQEEAVLLRHASHFSLAYFGPTDEASEGSWQDEWLEKNAQPQLVKISIGTTNGAYWPDMIIGLKVTGTATNEAMGTVMGNGAVTKAQPN